eukprot:scaffold14788_cov127-Isochrysis_galbana.AAC.2
MWLGHGEAGALPLLAGSVRAAHLGCEFVEAGCRRRPLSVPGQLVVCEMGSARYCRTRDTPPHSRCDARGRLLVACRIWRGAACRAHE